jgi:hypothetical protein
MNEHGHTQTSLKEVPYRGEVLSSVTDPIEATEQGII